MYCVPRTGLLILALFNSCVSGAAVRGDVELEYRQFTESPLSDLQHDGYPSLRISPEFSHASRNGRQLVVFAPFYRWDARDGERTHGDIRELYWQKAGDRYTVSLGIRKVFWGATESQHLVDVINQTDLVEDPDGEEKLGQPMIRATWLSGIGNFEFYLFPYFRERPFPGPEGRLRTQIPVMTGDAAYEHKNAERHVDWAVRWSRTVGNWDIGLSRFEGTSREPKLLPVLVGNGVARLRPYYELMQQTGIDLQGSAGAWLWKLEAINRVTHADSFNALTAGFEYTFYNVNGRGLDVGLVAEYLYDDRDEGSTSGFEDDVMLGLRLNPNDVNGSEFLLGVIADRGSGTRLYRLEASRRLTDHLKLALEATAFSGYSRADVLYALRRDDFIKLGLAYHF